jgi:outer membrane protein assembly factor BamB
MVRIASVVAAVALVSGAARAWVSIPAERLGVGESIAAFANGDWVMVATFYDSRPDQADNAIVRIDGATGGVVWLRELDVADADDSRQVAIDSAGNVVLFNFLKGVVWKIDGATGEVLWQNDIGELAQRGAFALDAHDDVLVGGAAAAGAEGFTHDLVVKLAATNGAVLWRVEGTGYDVSALAVGPEGDAFVISGVDPGSTIEPTTVRRMSGIDGHAIWTTSLLPEGFTYVLVRDARLDGFGRLIVLISSTRRDGEDRFWEIRSLDAASGDLAWRTTIQGSSHEESFNSDRPIALAVSAGGTIYAIGTLGSPALQENFALVAIDAAAGGERWRYVLPKRGLVSGVARAVAVEPDGSPVVTGQTVGKKSNTAMFVCRLRPSDGQPLWETTVNLSPPYALGEGVAVALDRDGTIGVAGTLGNPSFDVRAAIVKLLPNGVSF